MDKEKKDISKKDKKTSKEEFYFDPSQTFLSEDLLENMIKEEEKKQKKKEQK